MEKIGVLFLETSLEQGGAEQVVCELVRRLDRASYRPVTCCLYAPGSLGRRLMSEGATVYHGLMRSRADVRVLHRLRKLMLREKISVVYMVNQPLTVFWGTVCARLLGVPVVSAIHSTYARKTLKVRICKAMFPWVSRLVAVAEEQRRHLVQAGLVPQGQIEVIYNGVDVERFRSGSEGAEAKAALGICPWRQLVGAVARLDPRKGVDVLLRAAGAVLALQPQTHFVLVGDGPDRGRLERSARELGLDGRVTFLGMRRDVPQLLCAFDVCVLPSRTEALPLALLEYLAAGKPVVATRVGSVGEVVTDGVHGLLVAPDDARALAAAIARLLADGEMARALAEAGRRRVEGQFTTAAMVKRTEELFLRLCGQALGPQASRGAHLAGEAAP